MDCSLDKYREKIKKSKKVLNNSEYLTYEEVLKILDEIENEVSLSYCLILDYANK